MKIFIEAESIDRLRRALKTKTRVTTGISYDLADLAYYKKILKNGKAQVKS